MITRKPVVLELVKGVIQAYQDEGLQAAVASLNEHLLKQKVRFPLLEYCANELSETLPLNQHIPFLDSVEKLKREGGNVILGKMLQNRLKDHFEESLAKATEYISKADIWYVCDIIGERVYGFALLSDPEKTMPYIQRLTKHSSNWVVRSLGAGIHYAIKKGLRREEVEITFVMLLGLANTRDKEIKQGVGWAAKTTAKFHPEIIDKYEKQINGNEVGSWFRTKIRIGLHRNRYAQGN